MQPNGSCCPLVSSTTAPGYYGPESPVANNSSRPWTRAVLSGLSISVALLLTLFLALSPQSPAYATFVTLRGPVQGSQPPSPYSVRSVSGSRSPMQLPNVHPVATPNRPVSMPNIEDTIMGEAPKARPSGDDEPNYPLLLGRILDTLMRDYPRICTHQPDLSIMHPEIEVRDDAGQLLKGLDKYKVALQILRGGPKAMGWYPEVTARYTVDTGMREVKVRWHMVLNPHFRNPISLDGISIYKMGRDGLVYEHRLQYVTTSLIKQTALIPMYEIFAIQGRQQRVACPPPVSIRGSGMNMWADAVRENTKQTPSAISHVSTLLANARPSLSVTPLGNGLMQVADEKSNSLGVDYFTIGSNNNKPVQASFFELMDNLPPKLCQTKFDCEHKRGARCCDFLFVWSCCYPNNEDWPPSGGIGIPVTDPMPIPVYERDPTPPTQYYRNSVHRRLAAEESQAVDFETHYHPSPLADIAAMVNSCPLN